MTRREKVRLEREMEIRLRKRIVRENLARIEELERIVGGCDGA
jgi:hypothetical protein